MSRDELSWPGKGRECAVPTQSLRSPDAVQHGSDAPLIRGRREHCGRRTEDATIPGLQRTAFVALSAKTRVNALLALRRARERYTARRRRLLPISRTPRHYYERNVVLASVAVQKSASLLPRTHHADF
jgi:hypothetical protein